MVGIARYQHYEVEFSQQRQFIGFEGKPHVHAFFDDRHFAVLFHLAKVLVVENDIIFDERVLKLAFRKEQMLVRSVAHTVAAAEIVAFRDIAVLFSQSVFVGEVFADEVEQRAEVDVEVQVLIKCLVYFCIISSAKGVK